MSGKNLPFKFAALALAVGVCILAMNTKGCKEGIDLRGGYAITLGIQTPQADRDKALAELAKLEEARKTAPPEAQAELDRQIRIRKEQIEDLEHRAGENSGDLA